MEATTFHCCFCTVTQPIDAEYVFTREEKERWMVFIPWSGNWLRYCRQCKHRIDMQYINTEEEEEEEEDSLEIIEVSSSPTSPTIHIENAAENIEINLPQPPPLTSPSTQRQAVIPIHTRQDARCVFCSTPMILAEELSLNCIHVHSFCNLCIVLWRSRTDNLLRNTYPCHCRNFILQNVDMANAFLHREYGAVNGNANSIEEIYYSLSAYNERYMNMLTYVYEHTISPSTPLPFFLPAPVNSQTTHIQPLPPSGLSN